MCVLGWISRSYARDVNEIQTSGRRGSAGNIEKLGFLIPVNPKHAWKSWNLAWCHDMAPTFCGNFFGWTGTSFGISFLQTGASLKKARGSERNVSPPCAKRHTYTAFSRLNFLHRQIRPNRSIMLNFGIISGSFGLFIHQLSFWAFNVHNSNLNYKHMLQCTKFGWKITCVSLGEFLGPMQEMGMKFKHLGVVAQPRKLRNLVF